MVDNSMNMPELLGQNRSRLQLIGSAVPMWRSLPRGRPKASAYPEVGSEKVNLTRSELLKKMPLVKRRYERMMESVFPPLPSYLSLTANETELPSKRDRPYSCSICQASFMKRGHLMTHRFVHDSGKYSCKLCNRTFNFRFNLKRHVKMHTGQRPYVCAVCKYAFNLKGNLQIHFRVHMKIKPFGCFICKRRFTMKQNRDTHMRTHGTHRSFNCTICGRSYSIWGKLQTHRLRQHNVVERCCNFCGVAFDNREEHEIHFAQCEKRLRIRMMNSMAPTDSSNRTTSNMHGNINENSMYIMGRGEGRASSSSSRSSSVGRNRGNRRDGLQRFEGVGNVTSHAPSKSNEHPVEFEQHRFGSTIGLGGGGYAQSNPHFAQPEKASERKLRRTTIAMINEVNLIATASSPIASSLPIHRETVQEQQQQQKI
mmetsp:Transcript_20395/g.32867  ORF Transcript_20395/g.32867 Transcript_20395/m.32867 type:complete len:426 (+) Transcript_20395:253-1530(+)